MRWWKRADLYRHEAKNGRRRERRLRRDNRTLREKLQLLERAAEGERRNLLAQLSCAEEGLIVAALEAENQRIREQDLQNAIQDLHGENKALEVELQAVTSAFSEAAEFASATLMLIMEDQLEALLAEQAHAQCTNNQLQGEKLWRDTSL